MFKIFRASILYGGQIKGGNGGGEKDEIMQKCNNILD
jgi:hypothetical protein